MNRLELKYGCNPNQKPARVFMADETDLPFRVLGGTAGYINLLDALGAWQLVRELSAATGLASAASFKHTSPAGAALGLPLEPRESAALLADGIDGLCDSPAACAYARARGADRVSSFGDFIALSSACDLTTARLIRREVSDGIIAPAFTPEALELLRGKKGGKYCIIQIDPTYEPAQTETKQLFGVSLSQRRNDAVIDERALEGVVTRRRELSAAARRDLVLAMICAKYTQSNSVCVARGGQALGIGAGQQSRVHCTRLCCDKADRRLLREHEKVTALPFIKGCPRPARDNAIDSYIMGDDAILEDGVWQRLFSTRPSPLEPWEKAEFISHQLGLALASDAFFPFPDSIERAAKSGVEYIVQAGGSVRDSEVIEECDRRGIVMVLNGIRLFCH